MQWDLKNSNHQTMGKKMQKEETIFGRWMVANEVLECPNSHNDVMGRKNLLFDIVSSRHSCECDSAEDDLVIVWEERCVGRDWVF